MWALLKANGINAKLHTVRLLMLQIDPEAVEGRRKKRLKRRLKDLGLKRLITEDSHDVIEEAVRDAISPSKSSSVLGKLDVKSLII